MTVESGRGSRNSRDSRESSGIGGFGGGVKGIAPTARAIHRPSFHSKNANRKLSERVLDDSKAFSFLIELIFPSDQLAGHDYESQPYASSSRRKIADFCY